MTYTPVIYQWPVDVAPIDQLFRAGGMSIVGGMTLGGMVAENPEPGGRAELIFGFSVLATLEANKAMSWLSSRMMGGAVFSVPIYNSVQLVPDAEIIGRVPADNFATTTDQYSGLPVRRWDPFVPVTTGGLQGATTVSVNMADLSRVLNEGHVIGFRSGAYDFAHVVLAVSYDGANIATITVSPPLRRDVAAADRMYLRPKMLATVSNAGDFATVFTHGRHMTPSSARMVEVLV